MFTTRYRVLSFATGALLFFSNARGYGFPWALPLSLGLLLVPLIAILFTESPSRSDLAVAGAGVMGTVLFANFLIAWKEPSITGFQDPHLHLVTYYRAGFPSGHLDFSKLERISFNFVSVYFLLHASSLVMGVSPDQVAIFLPPLMNTFLAACVFVVVRQIHSTPSALLATAVYAIEGQVLLFGRELRTQTIGTILILTLLLLLFARHVSRQSSIGLAVSEFLIVAGLAMTSFVSWTSCFMLLVTWAASWQILRFAGWKLQTHPSSQWGMVGYSLLFLLTYVLFISGGIGGIFQSLRVLILDFFSKESLPSSGTGQLIYGEFIRYATYTLWFLGAVACAFYIREMIVRRNTLRTMFFVSFAVLAAFAVGNALGGPLSSGRLYVMAHLLLAVTTAYYSIKLISLRKTPTGRRIVSFAISLGVVIVTSVAMAKLPSYIIGDPSPIRGEEPIDLVGYWHAGDQDRSAATFVCNADQVPSVRLEMALVRFEFLSQCGPSTSRAETILRSDTLDGRPLVNAWKGDSVAGRDLIYSSGDYLLYWSGNGSPA